MTTATARPSTTVLLSRGEHHGAPLFVAMLGFFVVALDAQIVNVALPAIGDRLGGGLSGLQWVVTAYTLTFSSLLLFRRHPVRPDRRPARLRCGDGAVRDRLGGVRHGAVAGRADRRRPRRQRPADMPLWLVAALVPVGVGGSFTVPPLTSLLLEAVPAEQAGTASGVLNSARQVGGSMGVAISGAVIAHLAGLMPGLCTSLLAVALMVVVTTGLSLAVPGTRTAQR